MMSNTEDYIEEEPSGNGSSEDGFLEGKTAAAIVKMKTQVNYSTATD